MVTSSYTAVADRPMSLALRASLLMTVIATFTRSTEAVLSVNATQSIATIGLGVWYAITGVLMWPRHQSSLVTITALQ